MHPHTHMRAHTDRTSLHETHKTQSVLSVALQAEHMQSDRTHEMHTHAHITEAYEPRRWGLLYFKKHNIKIGESQLKSGCLKR